MADSYPKDKEGAYPPPDQSNPPPGPPPYSAEASATTAYGQPSSQPQAQAPYHDYTQNPAAAADLGHQAPPQLNPAYPPPPHPT